MAEGLFDKIKLLIGVEEDDYEDDDEYITDTPEHTSSSKNSVSSYSAGYSDRAYNIPQSRVDAGSKVVNMQSSNNSMVRKQFKLLLFEPESFEECPKLVDNLRNQKSIIVNLEKPEPELARKIFDFISGATYALNGKAQRISNNIFLFAPENVDVTPPSNRDEKDDISKGPWRK